MEHDGRLDGAECDSNMSPSASLRRILCCRPSSEKLWPTSRNQKKCEHPYNPPLLRLLQSA